MDIEQILAFRAVAVERGFSRAAEKLFKTQPAISQSIRLLEKELGETLFLRLGRTTTLTQAGRILLEHVNQALNALERGRSRIEALKELREGTLRIGASDTTTCYLLPPVLREFRKRYPGVDVTISNRPSPIVARQVAEQEADLGILTLPIEDPRLSVEPLTVREDVAICSPRHSLAHRKRVDLEELTRYPTLLLDRGSNTRSFIDRQLESRGAMPHVAMELGSIEVIKRLVELDFGVSIVPRIAVIEDVARGVLHAMKVFPKEHTRILGAVYSRHGMSSLAAQVFLGMLKKHLSTPKRGRSRHTVAATADSRPAQPE